MRLATFLSALGLARLAFPLAADSACGTTKVECDCVVTLLPSVVIDLPCATTPLPTMTLSGVCAGKGSQQAGQLAFGASDPGTCHVELGYADGSTVSTDVTFSADWLACGSDPHGCGQRIHPDGLPQGPGGLAVLTAGAPCDAGVLPEAEAREGGADAAGDAGGCRSNADCPSPVGALACQGPNDRPNDHFTCLCASQANSCTNDAQCGAGKVCRSGLSQCVQGPGPLHCASPCTGALDCAPVETCATDEHCRPLSCAECPSYFSCSSGACVVPSCTGDDACPGGYCVNGSCAGTLGVCHLSCV